MLKDNGMATAHDWLKTLSQFSLKPVEDEAPSGDKPVLAEVQRGPGITRKGHGQP